MRPMLVIMAAGMGSRFGGLKQMTAVDGAGQVILDYSAYDAMQAGFEKVVCVIKKEIEADFRALVGDRIGKKCDLHYAFQDLADIPAGFSVPPAGQALGHRPRGLRRPGPHRPALRGHQRRRFLRPWGVQGPL